MPDDLGYLGRYQRGQRVPVTVRTESRPGADQPAPPPVLTIYSPAAPPVQMFQGYMACDLQGDEDGVFRLSPFLDSTFIDAGLYSVVVRYETAGGTPVVLTGYFNLLPGGSDGGR
jgi:hypothetical protein